MKSDLRIFGKDDDKTPWISKGLTLKRDIDKSNVFLFRKSALRIVACIKLWQIEADKLYQTYQVFASQERN